MKHKFSKTSLILLLIISLNAQLFLFVEPAFASPPNTPTLDASYLHDNVKISDTTPELRFTATDPESNDLTYQIAWDTDSSFPSPTAKTSDTDPGFADVTNPPDPDPFASGDTVSYTFQSALSNNTTYFYRVRAKDPGGDNTYGSWSSIRSFTIDTSATETSWFQTHADQFSTDTLSGTTADESGNYLKIVWYNASWDYRKPVTLTYSGVGVTNHDVVMTIDTQTLISNNKMQSDCDDIRVTDSDGTTELNYFVEGGCNETTTQVWATVPSIPNGGKTLYVYYGNSSATNNEQTWTGNFILCYTAPTCPSGWSQDSTFDQRFPYGAASYGSTGGSSAHSHTTWTGNTGVPSDTAASTNTDSAYHVANETHLHSVSIPVQNNSNVLPPYLDLVYCKGNDLVIPQNFIAMFDTAPASGWTRVSTLDTRFPRGNTTYAGIGGSASHSHTTGSASTGQSPFPDKPNDWVSWSAGRQTHTHSVSASTTANADNTPPYLDMLFYKANSQTSGADNMIVMANAVPPLGWTRFSTLDDKFPRGNSSYGGTGGNASHSHSVTISTAQQSSPYGYRNNTGTNWVSNWNHTHTISFTTSQVSNLPPYATSYFIERKTPEASTSVGSEGTHSGTVISTAITAANINASATFWKRLYFTDDETNSDIKYKLYYDVSGTPTIVPDGALPGNSTGFDTSPVDLSSLGVGTSFAILYIKAELSGSGGDPQLQDWQVTLGDNAIPNAPTIDSQYLHDNVKTNDVTPEIRFSATDNEADDLTYQIQWDTDSSFPSPTSKTSDADAGFSDVTDSSDNDPFGSGDTISYTFQTSLSNNTTYFYRVKVKDPNGSTNYSGWSSIRSFTIDTSISNNAWFQTHADQFSTDTLSGTTAHESGHYLYPNPANWLSDYTYKLSIPITYSGAGVTDHDVVITIDTNTLISNNKMQDDCDDIRVTDSDGTTELSYWVEGGCDTDKTQVWVRVPDIPNGGKTIYVYYGNSSASNNEQTWTGNFILGYTDPACTTGWTRDDTFGSAGTERFPYGAASYGSTGGSASHSHANFSGATGPSSSNTGATTGTGVTITTAAHSHTVTIPVNENTNVLPPYFDLVYCKGNDLLIPQNFIAMFDTAPSSGWTTFPEMNERFPRGSSIYAGIGGSASHSHTTSAASTTQAIGTGNFTTPNVVGSRYTHTHSVPASAVDNADNTPPYVDLLFYKANSQTTGTDNMILMADAVPLLGWTTYPELTNRFPRGNTVGIGATGGNASHSHTASISTSQSSQTTNFTAGSTSVSRGTHTHTISFTTDAVSNLPPYATSYFIERKTPEASTSIGSETQISANAISTAITGNDIYFSATKWDSLSFNDTGSITYKIYYDVLGTPTIVPDGSLPGNSTGFTTSPVDLSSLTTKDYPILYIKAEFGSADAQLQDWTVSLGTPLAAPTVCVIDETSDDSSLTFKWADNSSGEDGFDVDRSVDGAAYADLATKGAGATSHQDSGVSQSHTYSYRVRAYSGAIYTPWCYSQTLNLQSASFRFEGLKMEGVKID
jgi:hypothetical protein